MRRLVLHVGAMKSGTSHIQHLLFTNQDVLASRGVLVPGEVWRDQVDAVSDALHRTRVGRTDRPGAWKAMVETVRAHSGLSIISMEFLARAPVERIREVVEQFPDLRVEAVVTARDLGRNLPAMWQERVKNGSTTSWEDYLTAVETRSDGEGKSFWREQGIAGVVRRWSEVLGTDALTLVTVPPRGAPRELLWERFAEAVGIDPRGMAAPPDSNESLGAASVEVVRRVNAQLQRHDLDHPGCATVVKHRLAKRVLAEHRAEEPGIGFEVPPWLEGAAGQMVSRVADTGVRVVGDLAELTPVSTRGVDPREVSAEEQLAAATAGLEGLVRTIVQLRAELTAARTQGPLAASPATATELVTGVPEDAGAEPRLG